MEMSPRNFGGLLILVILWATNSHITSCHKFVHCNIPDRWIGSWRSDSDTEALKYINITSDGIEGKGKCTQSSENYYVFTKKKDDVRNCSTCLSIFEMHFNVLRYREYSTCDDHDDDGLQDSHDLCDQIETHSQFHSLYRANPQLVEACPFKRGRYTFTYRRKNHCDSTNSVGYTCADPSGYFLKYDACHDVDGSESKKKIVSCSAAWQEGGNIFVIASIWIKGEEPVLRCLNYKSFQDITNTTIKSGYKIALSGTASCSALDVASSHGDEYLVMTKAQDDTCNFPDWMRGDWQMLNNSSMKINFTQGNTFVENIDFKERHRIHTKHSLFTCSNIIIQATDKYIQVYGVYLVGCQRYYPIMTIHRRGRFVLQIEVTHMSTNDIDPPTGIEQLYNAEKGGRIYILPEQAKQSPEYCPFDGKYEVTNLTVAGAGSSVWMSCKERHTAGGIIMQSNSGKLEFFCNDNTKPLVVLHCYSRWTRYGNKYFLGSVEQSSQLRCFKITKLKHPCNNSANQLLQIESSSQRCEAQNNTDPDIQKDLWRFVLNLTEVNIAVDEMMDDFGKNDDSDADVLVPQCNFTQEAPQKDSPPNNMSSGKTLISKLFIWLTFMSNIAVRLCY